MKIKPSGAIEIDLATAAPKTFERIAGVLERACELGKNITRAETDELVAELTRLRDRLVN
jgi:hypothetical protein